MNLLLVLEDSKTHYWGVLYFSYKKIPQARNAQKEQKAKNKKKAQKAQKA